MHIDASETKACSCIQHVSETLTGILAHAVLVEWVLLSPWGALPQPQMQLKRIRSISLRGGCNCKGVWLGVAAEVVVIANEGFVTVTVELVSLILMDAGTCMGCTLLGMPGVIHACFMQHYCAHHTVTNSKHVVVHLFMCSPLMLMSLISTCLNLLHMFVNR